MIKHSPAPWEASPRAACREHEPGKEGEGDPRGGEAGEARRPQKTKPGADRDAKSPTPWMLLACRAHALHRALVWPSMTSLLEAAPRATFKEQERGSVSEGRASQRPPAGWRSRGRASLLS